MVLLDLFFFLVVPPPPLSVGSFFLLLLFLWLFCVPRVIACRATPADMLPHAAILIGSCGRCYWMLRVHLISRRRSNPLPTLVFHRSQPIASPVTGFLPVFFSTGLHGFLFLFFVYSIERTQRLIEKASINQRIRPLSRSATQLRVDQRLITLDRSDDESIAIRDGVVVVVVIAVVVVVVAGAVVVFCILMSDDHAPRGDIAKPVCSLVRWT